MIFSSRLAKLGKATKINCRLVSDQTQTFIVFVCENGVQQKELVIKSKDYTLSKTSNTFMYNEVVSINDNYILARLGNAFSILAAKE